MKLQASRIIDGTRTVALIGSFNPAEDPAKLLAAVQRCVEAFEHFVSAGGLALPGRSQAHGTMLLTPGTLVSGGARFSYTFPFFPFGAPGLGVFLRMIAMSCAGVEVISVDGMAGLKGGPAAIEELELAFTERLPQKVKPPFALDLQPFGSWVTIECQMSAGYPSEVADALKQILHIWRTVVELGGYQVQSGPLAVSGDFGIGLDPPAEGEDFMSWQCSFPGVPAGALNGVVNLFSAFSRQRFALRSLYIG